MTSFYSHLDYYGFGTTRHLFSQYYGMTEVSDPKEADIIIWNGGEDIATSIYLENPVQHNIPMVPSKRDRQEIDLFDSFRQSDKLLLGICRGAQLLNCLNGGRLYQDVNGHHRSHSMVDLRSGETLQVTSTHHQQMIPNPKLGEVIGVSSCSTYKNREAGSEHFMLTKDLSQGVDVEIMWYPGTRSLCVQGHPEYVPESRFAKYTLELINEKRATQ